MEVVSTGGLPANLSRADFFRGISKPVNEELARLFIRLDLMEQTGYGIPRITQSYGQDAFEFLDFFLRVTIRFAFEIDAEAIGNEPINAQTSNYEPTNEPINANISDSEPINEPINEPIKHILDIISAYPNMSKEQIAERIGKSRATVTRLLGVLIRQGKIRRVGANKNGYWEVLEQHNDGAWPRKHTDTP